MNINDREDFYKIIDYYDYQTCAEIGVQAGRFSETLLKSQSIKSLFLIDCWTHQENYKDIANVTLNEQEELFKLVQNKFVNDSRVHIVRGFSIEVCETFADLKFDFIYLDANHSYDEIKKDIHHWYAKLKFGGMLSGHDYLDGDIPQGNFGVKKAVDEFAKEHNHEVFITDEPEWKSWYFLKK